MTDIARTKLTHNSMVLAFNIIQYLVTSKRWKPLISKAMPHISNLVANQLRPNPLSKLWQLWFALAKKGEVPGKVFNSAQHTHTHTSVNKQTPLGSNKGKELWEVSQTLYHIPQGTCSSWMTQGYTHVPRQTWHNSPLACKDFTTPHVLLHHGLLSTVLCKLTKL